MPHVIVKLWPGKTERQKQDLAAAITKSVMSILNYGDDAVSVAMEEVAPDDWTKRVYQPDISGRINALYKRPGYGPAR
jgi:4-oxalocrotonate tautomerase